MPHRGEQPPTAAPVERYLDAASDVLRKDPAQQEIFQVVFGTIMTALMALEFNHSILSVLERRHGIVQVRTVVLIALLALVRKFVLVAT